ncbi:hypothetical protein CEE45_16820 [Candidatus Heimdallarchaeota archaeon B3_Heim]|nr:MAG: hypothetical protein CEE45_16820 [Candidatus Heimdallarchaeota archaeon B3_Heim]
MAGGIDFLLSILLGVLIWHLGTTKYASVFSRFRFLLHLLVFSVILVLSLLSVLNLDLTHFLSFPFHITSEIDPVLPLWYVRLEFFDFTIFTEVLGRSILGWPELLLLYSPSITLLVLFLNFFFTFVVISFCSFVFRTSR